MADPLVRLAVAISLLMAAGLLALSGCGPSKEQRAINASNQGVHHYERGELDEAIIEYTKAIRLNPKNADTYFNRGIAYADKGELDNAIADYDKAIRLDPTNGKAHHNRGVAYSFSGQYEKAWADVEACRRLGCEVHPAFLAKLRKESGRQK